MTLIKSISGIRGTIGGEPQENLTPIDVVRFAVAYGAWLSKNNKEEKLKVVTGRDARISGKIVHDLVNATLMAMGIDIVDLDLSTTPTVEVAVVTEEAQGGIILTASHNPKEWNALKLLNHKGEFISAEAGAEILKIAEAEEFRFAGVNDLGRHTTDETALEKHIDQILKLDLVKTEAIKKQKFKVVVDGVHSTGGIAVPLLLEKLGVSCIPLYCEPTGHFPHNPEPLKEHLGELCKRVITNNADLGIAVDPDVDRLVFVDEKGMLFGEEYTLVACADYVLEKRKGNTVSNLSSTRALKDVTLKHGGKYTAAAVGEVHVVATMKSENAVIGGEGNGGIILPELHYGRDALVGIALFLSLLSERNSSVSELKETYPKYFMSKNKVALSPGVDVDKILAQIAQKYQSEKPITVDGVKIDFEKEWVHLRKSNTEPIIRIYTEAQSQATADSLGHSFVKEITSLF